jgi:preprotein translocase subunit SecF
MINFLKYSWIYFLISAFVIGAGLFSIARWGYTYSIDFLGGTNLEYRLDREASLNKIKDIVKKNKVESSLVEFKGNILTIRAKVTDEKKELKLRQDLERNLNTKITVLRSESVGPTIGAEAVRKTLVASVLAIIGILIYMTFAFKGFSYAIAAIVALIHDFLVVIGIYSLISHFYGAQFDTLFVTALLTSMSFSVHDTIVIFDKIREYMKIEGKGDINRYANKALTETMVRSLNNSMTIIFMLLALVLLGGDTIKYFAVALLIGTVTGTYSSPFVATPLVTWLERTKK